MSTDPGLDLTVLRGLRSPRPDLATTLQRIEDHLDQHEGYVPFSGGKDSLVVVHLAHQVDPEVPIVFFDSGLEYPETYEYLKELARSWCLNFHRIDAQHTTLQILQANGAWDQHAERRAVPDLRQVLIDEPAAHAHASFGPGELWGVRAAEANGRAAAYANALRREERACGSCATPQARRARHGGVIRRVDGTVAYGPVWNWSDEQIWGHISRHRLPVNPVYEKLRKLGAPEYSLRVSHMIDGSHLHRGRLTWLQRGWPALFDELATLLPRMREYV